MPRVGDDHCPGSASVGRIDQLSAVPGIGNDTFNRSRFGANDRNHPVRGHNVPEADIDQLDVHIG